MLTTLMRRVVLSVTAATLSTGALVAAPAFTGTPGAAADAAARSCPHPHSSILRSAPGRGRTVALTFDDGPTRFTPQILKILRKYDVRATFFETGAHVKANPAIARQVAAEGHLIGDHTYDHYYPTQVRGGWNHNYLGGQFTRSNSLIRSTTGQQPCFFRPPGGYQTAGMTGTAAEYGMSTVMWSVDTEDWKQPGVQSRAATGRIIARAEAGVSQAHPIVLMHDGKASHEPERQVSSNRSNDIAALPTILRYYKARGYRFVDLLGRSGLPAAPSGLTVLNKRTSGRVLAGTTVTPLVARLSSALGPQARRTVRWYSRPVGKHTWRLRGSLRTSSTGRVRVTDKPVVDTQYILRFAGSRTLKASATSVRTIRVKTVATTLVVRAAESVPAGDDVVLRGNVASAGVKRARATVIITRRPSAGGQSVTTRVLTNAQGDFTYVHHAATEAMVYAVSVAAKTPYRAAVARVTVTVTSDPGSTDPGSTEPGSTDPGSTDPGSTDPGSTEPGSTDPGSTDPGTATP